MRIWNTKIVSPSKQVYILHNLNWYENERQQYFISWFLHKGISIETACNAFYNY